MTIKKEATAKVVIRKDRQLKDDTYQIAVRVTYNRKSKYYSTKKSLSIDDFTKIEKGTKLAPDLKDLSIYFKALESNANLIIKDLGNEFTFDKFKTLFLDNKPKEKAFTLQSVFEDVIKTLEQKQQYSTLASYNTALNQLNAFKPNFSFDDCTQKKLEDFETYLKSQDVKESSINTYLSKLKFVLNTAIDKGLFSRDNYPFGKRRYTAPKGISTKHTALSKEDLRLLLDCEPLTDNEDFAKDMFFLSFYCNGANLKDLFTFNFDSIDFEKKELSFVRSKTAKKTGKRIFVKLHPLALSIIEKHKNTTTNKDNYLLNILYKSDNPKIIQKKVKAKTSLINNSLNSIATRLGLGTVTTYTARHTFASLMYQKTKDIYLVSKMLGHSNIQQTTTYLHNLGELQNENNYNLIEF